MDSFVFRKIYNCLNIKTDPEIGPVKAQLSPSQCVVDHRGIFLRALNLLLLFEMCRLGYISPGFRDRREYGNS